MAFSFFFRDRQTLEHAVRLLCAGRIAAGKTFIWDAGCAEGKETYTLAILLAEIMGNFAFRNTRILATDIDPQGTFGAAVMEGTYSFETIQRIPSEIRTRYFRGNESGKHEVAAYLKSRVSFMRHDIRTPLQREGEQFAMIVCKNVLLHLTDAEKNHVVELFSTALKRNGLLVFEQTLKPPSSLCGLFKKADDNFEIYRKIE